MLFIDQILVLGQSRALMDSKSGIFGGPVVNRSDNENSKGTCAKTEMPERFHVCAFDVKGTLRSYSGTIKAEL